jgi:hypothetical protein
MAAVHAQVTGLQARLRVELTVVALVPVPLGVAGDEGETGRAHGARYKWDVFGGVLVVLSK